MKNKKAVSPIISTVLLIMIVIILAIIILLWSKGFIKEALTKEIGGSEQTVNKLCQEIQINPIINDDDTFGFENTGNVPIYAFNVKLVGEGSSETVKISKEEGGYVNPGFTTIVEKSMIGDRGYSKFQKVKIIPILFGQSKKSRVAQESPCPEENGVFV